MFSSIPTTQQQFKKLMFLTVSLWYNQFLHKCVKGFFHHTKGFSPFKCFQEFQFDTINFKQTFSSNLI